jgi:hypothetical protein
MIVRRQIFIEHCEVQGYVMGPSVANTYFNLICIHSYPGTHAELNIIYTQYKKDTS